MAVMRYSIPLGSTDRINNLRASRLSSKTHCSKNCSNFFPLSSSNNQSIFISGKTLGAIWYPQVTKMLTFPIAAARVFGRNSLYIESDDHITCSGSYFGNLMSPIGRKGDHQPGFSNQRQTLTFESFVFNEPIKG